MLSRSANSAVKMGGMCWTTAIGTGMSCSPLITVVSASGPPVETPMTTTSTFAVDARRSRGAATIGGAATLAVLGTGAAGRRNRREFAAASILGIRSARTAAIDAVTLPTLAGLVT